MYMILTVSSWSMCSCFSVELSSIYPTNRHSTWWYIMHPKNVERETDAYANIRTSTIKISRRSSPSPTYIQLTKPWGKVLSSFMISTMHRCPPKPVHHVWCGSLVLAYIDGYYYWNTQIKQPPARKHKNTTSKTFIFTKGSILPQDRHTVMIEVSPFDYLEILKTPPQVPFR